MSESQSKRARSAEDIQAEIEATRQRLADNLAQLKTETTPQALAQRAGHAAKGLVFDHETGEWRRERIIAIGGVVVGLLLVRKGLRRRAHRRELERLREVVWVPVPRASVNPEYAAMARTATEVAPEPLVVTSLE